MKKGKKIVLWMLLFTFVMLPCISYAEETEEGQAVSQEEVLNSQMEQLGIQDFLEEGKHYASEVYGDLDLNQILTDAITGKVNNEGIIQGIIHKLGEEVFDNISLILNIIIIIVIHSILRSFTEGLENKGIGKVAYYAQYLLIATIILTSFTQIISMVKDAVENLVGFMDCLIPILITLLVTTRFFCQCGDVRTDFTVYHNDNWKSNAVYCFTTYFSLYCFDSSEPFE